MSPLPGSYKGRKKRGNGYRFQKKNFRNEKEYRPGKKKKKARGRRPVKEGLKKKGSKEGEDSTLVKLSVRRMLEAVG